uniref:CWF19-like protein 1 homolog n=1 Tax=Rhabditophanes sp. KR3021 TaxID=114890 RepID=A0AC35UGY1_9BILA
MAQKLCRVLVVGNVEGKFDELIKKVNAVDKKAGPFELLFCVGEFFSKDDHEANKKLLSFQIKLPIQTYILGPSSLETEQYYPAEGCDICENVFYLGKSGIFKSANGLKIAYLSGTESGHFGSHAFDKSVVNDLLYPVKAMHGYLGCDILLTSEWPKDISKFSTNIINHQVEGSMLISQVASALKPRYHFAGLHCHYERTPYRNHRVLLDVAQHVTRFIGLNCVGNKSKEKWLYAFNITPIAGISKDQLVQQPDNTTEFPYMDILTDIMKEEKQKEHDNRPQGAYTKFDLTYVEENSHSRKRKNDEDDNPSKKPYECWFCLSNVKAEKHLIVSIGETCYAAMPKGPMSNDHILIMSIEHTQSLVGANDNVKTEIRKFINAYTLFCSQQNKALVAYERNYKTGHVQINLIPVPNNVVKYLHSSFVKEAEQKEISLITLDKEKEIFDVVNPGIPYFYVELPDGSKLYTDKLKNFPLQFAREVLASHKILDCPEKEDWKDCTLTKEEETSVTAELKELFKPFDFTNDSDDDDE